MASNNPLLDAMLRKESGGRNITNTDATTSSGRARGYFQITDGTWNDFGGGQFAPSPLGASYAQQAQIASKIPLKRWDPSTISAMRATGLPVDPSQTLGQVLGGNFNSGAHPALTVPGMALNSNPVVASGDPITVAPGAPAPPLPSQNINDHPIADMGTAPTPATMPPNLMADITKLTTPTGADGKGASPLGGILSALQGANGQSQQPQVPQPPPMLQSSDMADSGRMQSAQQMMTALMQKRKPLPIQGGVPGMNLGGMSGFGVS